MISTAIKRAFEKAGQRGWDKLYMAIDVHDTMIKANYKKGEIPTDFFPLVLETLRYIQERGDIVLIMYTCSHEHEIAQYNNLFVNNSIDFDYFNENPEVLTKEHGLGNYDKKFYFDILIEDKAGFDPWRDWSSVLLTLVGLPILTK